MEEEEFVEGEAAAGFFVGVGGIGEVGGDDGFPEGRELEAGEGVFGQEFAEAWGPLL